MPSAICKSRSNAWGVALRRNGTGLDAIARFLCTGARVLFTGCTGRRQSLRALQGRVVPKAARRGLPDPVSAPAPAPRC